MKPAILALLAVSLLAQQPPPAAQRPTFRANTELVQVDVVVTDKDGQPVRGLKAEDFTVLDRGKAQPVATFQEIFHDRPPSSLPALPPTLRLDVAANRTSRSDRLVMIVLDDLHTYRGRNETVKSIARRVVTDLGPQASMGLLTTSGDQRVELTEDRSLLLAAIDHFNGHQAVRRPLEANDSRRGGSLQEFDANMRLYGALQGAAKILASDDGRRKAFVLVSENLAKDLTGLFGPMRAPADAPPDVSAYYASGDATALVQVQPTQYHATAVLDMMDAMRRANVATYAIDPRGKISTRDLGLECAPTFGEGCDVCKGECPGQLPDWDSWVRQAQHGLDIMAQASGGFAIVDTNDFTSGLGRILNDLDNYYLLGFYPQDTTSKGYRPLQVTVNRPDVTLRYRRGYEIGGPPVEPKKQDALVALAYGVLPKADLPMRLFATSLPNAGNKEARVPIALEVTVPRKELEASDARLQDDIRYSVMVVDLKGDKVKERVGTGARLTLKPRGLGGPPPDTVTYQIDMTMTLAPGQYQLRVSATSAKLDKGGSVYLSIDVPDFGKPPIAVSGLVVGYADGARVPVAATQMTQARGRGRGPAPQARPDLPFAPSLDREFVASDELWLHFEVARHDLKAATATVATVDATDRILKRVAYPIVAKDDGKVTMRVPLKDLAAGAYRLRVTAADGQNTAEREIGFVIR